MTTLSGRCYTKSGSIEKYESDKWEGIISTTPFSGGNTPYISSAPNSNGNYQVSSRDSNNTTSCTTRYGGVTKIFTFTVDKKIAYMVITIKVKPNYGPSTDSGNYCDYLYINWPKSYIGEYSINIHFNAKGGNFNIYKNTNSNGGNEFFALNRLQVSINSVTYNGKNLKSGITVPVSSQYANVYDEVNISATGW